MYLPVLRYCAGTCVKQSVLGFQLCTYLTKVRSYCNVLKMQSVIVSFYMRNTVRIKKRCVSVISLITDKKLGATKADKLSISDREVKAP